MLPSSLRATTTVHAYAVTVVDDSQRGDAARPNETANPPSVVVLPADGDVVGGVYRLTRLLGAGMFGKVFVAQREDVPEHRVALKLLPRSHYVGRNVERELVMLATVGHPHVVQLKDHGMTAEYVWFTMPVYQGETLAERLARGPLEMREAHDVFLAVARGLEALHAAGLRHQDIKPENIYLAVFGQRVHPILLDLGVAAEREATFVAGTALYASPEQLAALRGKGGAELPLTEKMDTYCLAATLLVSLVGDEHFPGANVKTMEDLERSLEIRADRPLPGNALLEIQGDAREKIEAAFKRWLSLDPAARPSMSRMAEELDVLLEPERDAARTEEQARQRQKTALQRFRIAAGALLVLAGAGGWVAYSNRETIRLGRELEAARAEGARSFDKLDMCNASYRTSRGDLARCEQEREDEKKRCNDQMEEELRVCGSDIQIDCALAKKKLMDQHAAQLKACETDAEAAARAAEEARAKLEGEWDTQRVALMAERDEQKKLAESRANELATCNDERTRLAVEHNGSRGPTGPTGTSSPAGSPTTGPSTIPASPPAAHPEGDDDDPYK
ncbi:serine/threonine protein kinase [Polyangium aurulentum]|uniref:serine/threonine protein kinase n=1 Tax=Polyangium aurulentum TaxID=2567896 RepID=UPI0010AECFE4|nr:serine/threonine-protein kinase [Polyangium aurulentum]UQA58054.1 serine/threonine protein kinase [Polyangium aurulentum]